MKKKDSFRVSHSWTPEFNPRQSLTLVHIDRSPGSVREETQRGEDRAKTHSLYQMQEVSDAVTELSGLDSVDVTSGPFKTETGRGQKHLMSLSQHSSLQTITERKIGDSVIAEVKAAPY